MHQPKGDPFFEQLKADIQEGIDAADRGELFTVDQVREHFRQRFKESRRVSAPED